MTADIYLENESKLAFTESVFTIVRRAAAAALEPAGFSVACEINITITDNDAIRVLNKRHRGADEATDVLSFPLYTAEELHSGNYPAQMILGDIVISAEKAVSQASEYGHGAEREFAFLAAHGALHLLGYDHEDPEDEKIMEGRQNEILNALDLKR